MTAACCLEEIWIPEMLVDVNRDLARATAWAYSLIFARELEDKLMEAVSPFREKLHACWRCPSTPDDNQQDTLGPFVMWAVVGGPFGDFAQQVKALRDRQLAGGRPTTPGGVLQDVLLSLERILPKVLECLPGDQAGAARGVTLSIQPWLGCAQENLVVMLLRDCGVYVPPSREKGAIDLKLLMGPVANFDQAIWHPCNTEISRSMGIALSLQHWLAILPENQEAMLLCVSRGCGPMHLEHGAIGLKRIEDLGANIDPGRWKPCNTETSSSTGIALALQHRRGSVTENLAAMLRRVCGGYVPTHLEQEAIDHARIMDAMANPDQGIRNPCTTEDSSSMGACGESYGQALSLKVGLPKEAPTIGVGLQKPCIPAETDRHSEACVQ